jgi:hypothetical protein
VYGLNLHLAAEVVYKNRGQIVCENTPIKLTPRESLISDLQRVPYNRACRKFLEIFMAIKLYHGQRMIESP